MNKEEKAHGTFYEEDQEALKKVQREASKKIKRNFGKHRDIL
jgi:hypothetical protein